jgi:hypothetical protein
MSFSFSLIFPDMRTLICGLLLFISFGAVNAQSCRPAELNYIVRDESGNVMSETMLKRVFRQMKPPTSGVGSVAFADDGKLVGYSGKEPKTIVPAIFFVDAAACKLKIADIVLTRDSETMRLVFDLDIDRRAYTIDSVPFRAGTYRLDQREIADIDQNSVVPASRWKKVR